MEWSELGTRGPSKSLVAHVTPLAPLLARSPEWWGPSPAPALPSFYSKTAK